MQKIFDDFFEKTPAGHLIDIPLADPQKIQSDKKQIKNLKNLSKTSKYHVPLCNKPNWRSKHVVVTSYSSFLLC